MIPHGAVTLKTNFPLNLNYDAKIICEMGPRTCVCMAWWCHQMETFSALLALCAGNSPVNSPHKGQWCGALMFSLIYAWTHGWVNNQDTDDLRFHWAHYDITVMGHAFEGWTKLYTMVDCLTHWGRVTHICVGKLTIIGSDNGLLPGWRQAITWTNARILLIGPLRTNFSEILIEILTFSFKKIRLTV